MFMISLGLWIALCIDLAVTGDQGYLYRYDLKVFYVMCTAAQLGYMALETTLLSINIVMWRNDYALTMEKQRIEINNESVNNDHELRK